MLSNIPGIGLSTAKEILSYFNNDITKLIIEVKNDNKCLNEIKINNKKLNKKIIENINNYINKNK